jgi:hypothetical protein
VEGRTPADALVFANVADVAVMVRTMLNRARWALDVTTALADYAPAGAILHWKDRQGGGHVN